ncbi:ABC transporter ATP-binding protein [Legionella sp. WA2022007384]
MHNVSQLMVDYINQHKWSTVFFLIFGIFWAITLPYMAYLLGTIIDQIKNNGLNGMSIWFVAGVPVGLYITIHILRSLGYYVHALFMLFSMTAHKSHMINKLFSHLTDQSIAYFEHQQSGFLSNKVTNACISLEPIAQNIFTIIFPQSLAILITGILLSTVVPYFGLVLWIWGSAIIIYTYRAAKIGREKASIFANACSLFNGHMIDVVTNIQTVIQNVTIESESNLLQKNIDNLVKTERIRNKHAAKVMLIQHLAMNGLVAFYLIGSVIGYEYKLVSVGELVFVMTSVTAIAGLTNSLGNAFLELIYNLGLIKDGLSLLEDNPDVQDKENAINHIIQDGEINIQNVSFAYPKMLSVFNDFSLTIPAKQKIGIVGSSGAGKTTLIKLLMRLYDTTSGAIYIDGIDITDFKKTSLRSQISTVSQHLNLFHRSIFENIAYGCGKVTKEEVIEAAKKANCHEFIMKLEQGYDTVIGEQGVKLSGGQRQRVAIARAILKDSPILLLDEATSALDSVTEQAIQRALETLILDKTAIIVAHRLSTLKAMDKIIVLENGKVVESGSHQELIDAKKVYYEYWSHQSNGFIK